MASFYEIRSVLIKLIPFFLSVIIYFYGVIPLDDKILLAFIKCLPIACLMIFIALYLMDLKGEYNSCSYNWYAKTISLGLFFCGIGDAFAVWLKTYDYAVVAFAAGQIHYIIAFGFRPHAWIIGAFCYASVIPAIILFGSSLTGLDIIVIPIYTLILTTAIWRASAPLADRKYWSWIRLSTVFGVLMFASSNFITAIEEFKIDTIYLQVFVMVLYYSAQLLITLSVTEPYIPPLNDDSKFV